MKSTSAPLRLLLSGMPPLAVSFLRLLLTVTCIVVIRPAASSQLNQWTWKHGPSAVHQYTSYGTMGVPSATNLPGPRNNTITWVDASGNLWMFGGNRVSSVVLDSLKNDLWKWNGAQWTWMGGTNTANALGVYGTMGVAAPGNTPGGRSTAVSWMDAAGNLWLFGGYGYATSYSFANVPRQNDLWKWDGTNWTWVKGGNTGNLTGTYGTKGVAAAANTPGGRNYSVCWKDALGNAWVFGGLGCGITTNIRHHNDLWKWDGTNWTWVNGGNTGNQAGVYGTLGVPAATNVPGCRFGAIAWNDASGNGWIFGGTGYDSAGISGYLNDLWRWDGTYWTWMGGSKFVNRPGIYGTAGVSAPTNWPGSRINSVSWRDNNGLLWLMGGRGYDASGLNGLLNDMWTWNGTAWTWVSGSNIANRNGIYGTLGVSAATNAPGGKDRPAIWRDYNNAVWLFGGNGYGATGTSGYMNDMWRYPLHAAPLPMQLLSFEGVRRQQLVHLQWKVSGEELPGAFIVERSTDAQHYHSLSEIAVRGAGRENYNYTDTMQTMTAVYYYRLRIRGSAGGYRYSAVVRIGNGELNKPILYPNPVVNRAVLNMPDAAGTGGVAVVYDQRGNTMGTFRVQQTVTLDCSHYPAGVYCIRLPGGEMMRFVKKE